MVAVPLILGCLTAVYYGDGVATGPRIDVLRRKIVCARDPQFAKDYHDPEKCSLANSLTVGLNDATLLDEVAAE